MSGQLAGSASGYFGSMVEAYDSLIRRAVPRYDEMIGTLIEYMPRSAADILELGSGTGNLSLTIARRFPAASLTLVDGSAEMLAVARSRLEGIPRRRETAFIESRFEDLVPPVDSFDAVVSSISLHHIRGKGIVYRRMRAALRAGGTFCFADQLRGHPESNHAVNWERWLEYCRAPGNCSADEIQSLLDHAAAHDHYVTLSDHVEMLREAGFKSIDCVWRNGMWGILTATTA